MTSAHLIEETDRQLTPAQQSALARQLLARLLADRYGISPLPAITVTATGKPYFASHPGIHFSLSHCPRAVMAVISDAPVGCDIEEVQTDAPPELLQAAFSPAEQTRIAEAATPPLELTRIWTRKEAYVKRTGSIPDDPVDWPSEMPDVSTVCEIAKGYVYSISR